MASFSLWIDATLPRITDLKNKAAQIDLFMAKNDKSLIKGSRKVFLFPVGSKITYKLQNKEAGRRQQMIMCLTT
jgi:hypothetical protein